MSIEICHVCDGYGYTKITDPDSPSFKQIACKRCEGSGRLVRTKTYETLSSHGIEQNSGSQTELREAASNLLNQVEMASPNSFRSEVVPERTRLRAILAKVQS